MSKAEELAKKYTREEAWEKFYALPDSVQTVIVSPKTMVILDKIGAENKLSREKVDKLGRYVDLVLSGTVPITLFKETLEEELDIREGEARKIAGEVRDKIFMQVKEELKKVHNL